MEEVSHKHCYGTIFPEVMAQPGLSGSGKVFSFAIIPSTGLGPVGRKIHADTKQWDICRKCSEFEDCYRFSITKLAFEFAVFHRP